MKTENGLKVKPIWQERLRRYRIRVVMGDKVTVAVSPCDYTKGRSVFRHK